MPRDSGKNGKPMPKEPAKQECKKTDNQCKICLQEVTTRTGVQCQGACLSWVHYECLNYTPGKIQDIKEGHIILTCPCPDCKTTVPKEFIKDEGFTCNNVGCPANNPPACEEFDCQANEMSRCMPARCPPPGTLRTCGQRSCKEYSEPRLERSGKDESCVEAYTMRTNMKGDQRNQKNQPGGKPGCFPGEMPAGMPGGMAFNQNAMQDMLKTVGDLTQQLNKLMVNLNQLAAGGGGGGNPACPPGGCLPGGKEGNAPGAPGMKPCGSSGSSCEGKAGCKKCATGKTGGTGGGIPGNMGRKQCSGGCGQPGASTCGQTCHCPGNPVPRR